MRTGEDVLNLFEQMFEAEKEIAAAVLHAETKARELEQAKRELQEAADKRDQLQRRMQGMARKVAGVPEPMQEDDWPKREFVPVRR